MDVRLVEAAETFHLPQDSSISEDDYKGVDWNDVFLFSNEEEEL